MDDLQSLMEDHFIKYASYVILDRAIPNVFDGLKPVQRRILETLRRQNNDKFHKVANIVGQAMQFHPHGDAPIYEALVNLANKGFLIDCQGNFGNILTADPPAAARYIEARLSDLAKETMFNPSLTQTIPSYDGRNEEPVIFPAKVPLLLMQGAEGIAVGMSTKILPHNFKELLEAQIDYLQGRPFKIFPDFVTGGIMDKSDYQKGKGKIKLRTKIEIKDDKTLIIREICYGTTTESLIRSIEEAAKKGKIKIESINDYTAQNVEIEIKLPRGQYAKNLLDGLYAFTECEISLSSQIMVIKENAPWETDVHEILGYNTDNLVQLLEKELELEKADLLEKIFRSTLEKIFIEDRLYKKIEVVKTLAGIHDVLEKGFKPYKKEILREPTFEDREKLLQIPIRRISQFDIDKNQEEVTFFRKQLKQTQKHLTDIKGFTIAYIQQLIDKYGNLYRRRTRVRSIEEIDRRAIETKTIKVGFDIATGFVGTAVSGASSVECTNFDKLVVFHKNGTYVVTNISPKQYFEQMVFVGIADKKTVCNVVYKNIATKHLWVKRFVVNKFIVNKVYDFLDSKGELLCFSIEVEPVLDVYLQVKPRQKNKTFQVFLKDLPIATAHSRGTVVCKHEVSRVKLI
jgi:topoisomerase IV subunit A